LGVCRVGTRLGRFDGADMATGRRRSNSHLTGMRGVYLAAAELAKKGLIASPTSRSAKGADLLVTDRDCKKAWSVQVKTNASKAGNWLVNRDARRTYSPSFIYVFVSAPKEHDEVEFFVVPSRIVAKKVKTKRRKTGSIWRWYPRDNFYKSRWSVFGSLNDRDG
jgi:hypothetical protein